MDPRRLRFRAAASLLSLLCCGSTIRAQVQAGETQLSLDGTISGGYSGSMSNEGSDGHGLGFGGSGTLGGSYYSPQFLSFSVSPFYNQSRNNSNYQSITDSSGVTAAANIFAGSRFPGNVNFSKVFNNTSSNFIVPGLASYATNGNSETFGAGWAANFNTLPSLNFGYQQGDDNYSLFGTQQESFEQVSLRLWYGDILNRRLSSRGWDSLLNYRFRVPRDHSWERLPKKRTATLLHTRLVCREL